MAKNVKRKNFEIILGVIIVFIGICIVSSTYYNTKKIEVFDEMNELYYDQIVNMDVDLEDIDDEVVTTTSSNDTDNVTDTTTVTTTTAVNTIDYTKYYIGYLSIPTIDLEKGFTDIDSKYNNVNRNIYVLPDSDYPDVTNGNLILASHSGNSSISFFKNLYKLSKGDYAYITYNGKKYTYQITNIYTDTKDGTLSIRRNKSKTTLTLITCTKNDKTTQTIYICELVS